MIASSTKVFGLPVSAINGGTDIESDVKCNLQTNKVTTGIWNYANPFNQINNLIINMSLANSKQSFKSDVSINSDDIGSKEVTHDIYQVIPKDVIFEKTDHNNNSITNSPQDELINELLKIIHEEIKDISATNMQDLMRLTNLDVSNDEAYTHEIIIKPDTEPIKQKVRKIPYSFASEFRNMIEEMKRA